MTILLDLDAPELATETAGHVGHPLLSPTDTVQFQNTARSLREALGQQDQIHEAYSLDCLVERTDWNK